MAKFSGLGWALVAAAGLQVFGINASAQGVDTALSGLGARTREVCSGPAAEGFARCHSHVVIDQRGEVVVNATPGGLSPSSLRSAYKVTGSGSSCSQAL